MRPRLARLVGLGAAIGVTLILGLVLALHVLVAR